MFTALSSPCDTSGKKWVSKIVPGHLAKWQNLPLCKWQNLPLKWQKAHIGQDPYGPRPIWAKAHMGQGPYGPGPIWARDHMGQGPYGPGPIWAPGPWARALPCWANTSPKNAPWKKESKLCVFACVFFRNKKGARRPYDHFPPIFAPRSLLCVRKRRFLFLKNT